MTHPTPSELRPALHLREGFVLDSAGLPPRIEIVKGSIPRSSLNIPMPAGAKTPPAPSTSQPPPSARKNSGYR